MRRTHLDQDTLLALVEHAYVAAHDAAEWKGYLGALSAAVAGSAVVLVHHDFSKDGGASLDVGMHPEALALYNEHYHAKDPWACSPRSAELVASAGVVPDGRLVPRSALRKTEFYADFVSRFDVTRIVTMALSLKPVYSGVTVFRGERDQEFGDDVVSFLKALRPHVRRALALRDRLCATAEEHWALLECAEAIPCAVLVTDERGRVLLANGAGSELNIERDGIGIQQGVVTAASPAAHRRLAQLCAETAEANQVELRDGGAMVIPRPGSAVPLQVLAVPIRGRGWIDVPSRAAVIVFISDPLQNSLPSESLLRQYYQFTPTEAAVAARIASGRTLEEIALERRMTIETARWYSKQVLAKTGSRNRAELVRQIARTLPALFSRQ